MDIGVRQFKIVSRYEKYPELARTIIMPHRSTEKSCGYDIYLPRLEDNDIIIEPGKCSPTIKLGIKVLMDNDEYLELCPRSSLGWKKNLMLVNTIGKIDADYYNNPDNEGEICCKFFNYGEEVVELGSGEKVIQGIFHKYLTTIDDKETCGKMRIGGIGSTGS